MTCSTYTGEVENGLRQGQGMYWCALTGATYTGQWVAGRREGRGRLDYSGNGESYYDGDWVDNQQKGVGIRRYRYNDYLWNGRVGCVTFLLHSFTRCRSGNVYEGEWHCNERHGQGTMHWYDRGERYTGQWTKGIQQGRGEHMWIVKDSDSAQVSQTCMCMGLLSRTKCGKERAKNECLS